MMELVTDFTLVHFQYETNIGRVYTAELVSI